MKRASAEMMKKHRAPLAESKPLRSHDFCKLVGSLQRPLAPNKGGARKAHCRCLKIEYFFTQLFPRTKELGLIEAYAAGTTASSRTSISENERTRPH